MTNLSRTESGGQVEGGNVLLSERERRVWVWVLMNWGSDVISLQGMWGLHRDTRITALEVRRGDESRDLIPEKHCLTSP